MIAQTFSFIFIRFSGIFIIPKITKNRIFATKPRM